jgi:ribose-phosphate pyrophosphokinase
MSDKIKIYISSDHAGFELKCKIIQYFQDKYEILDFGTDSNTSCNYNEIAERMILKLQENSSKDQISPVVNFGILVCGTGTGMSIFANRFNNIRACNAISQDQIKLARSHNNSNVICFGEKFTEFQDAINMIETFINEKFEGGRHINRLAFDAKKCINLNYNGLIPQDYTEIKSRIKLFHCGEIEFEIQEDISNQEITIFQSFEVGKFNDDLMKLQIVCDVLKRNNVKKSTYFAPFIPYTRQDKTYDTKVSLGSKLIADIINNCGINEITTYDLHAVQIEGFFKCKVNHLSMIPRFIEHINDNFKPDNVVIVFPDAGSASRFKRFFADQTFKIAIINKVRTENLISMEILGDVKNKTAVVIDDMIDGGGTIIEASKILLENHANQVFAYATHGIFSDNAVEKLEKSPIERVVVGDSLEQKFLGGKVWVAGG